MKRYLIVAHQTAESPELLESVKGLMSEEPDVEFNLLVPATPVEHLMTWTEGESRAVARDKAERARARLEAAGARIDDALVGDASPLAAIREELEARDGEYDGIVICTFPSKISRWLQLDVVSQARRMFDLPVRHVEAKPAASKQRG